MIQGADDGFLHSLGGHIENGIDLIIGNHFDVHDGSLAVVRYPVGSGKGDGNREWRADQCISHFLWNAFPCDQFKIKWCGTKLQQHDGKSRCTMREGYDRSNGCNTEL